MSGDFLSGISSVIGGVISGAEQEIGKDLGLNGASTKSGSSSSASSGSGLLGALNISDSMSNFNLSALFGQNQNGIFGEIAGLIGGDKFNLSAMLGQLFNNKQNSTPPPGYAYVAPPPPGNTGGTTGSAPPRVSGCGGDVTGTGGDPRLGTAISSLETLMMNFSKCSSNGQMTPASLQQAAWDSSNPALQQAAKFFTSNPDLMRDLFTKGGGASASFDQLNSLDQMWTQMQKSTGATAGGAGVGEVNITPRSGAVPIAVPATGNGSTGTTTPQFTNIIAQLEQQIASLQQQLANGNGGSANWNSPPSINPNMTTGGSGTTGTTTTGTGLTGDAKTTGATSYAGAISNLQNQIAGWEADAQANPTNAPIDAQKISTANNEIQMLMQMQQQDFQMMSEILKDFHDMSMAAIRNING